MAKFRTEQLYFVQFLGFIPAQLNVNGRPNGRCTKESGWRSLPRH